MKPPTGGPSTGPSSAGTVRYDIACTISDFVTLRSSTSRPIGTIIAPPMPCTMRAPVSSERSLLTPHNIEPIVNTPIAARKTVRAPKRSAIQPLAGMKIATLRR